MIDQLMRLAQPEWWHEIIGIDQRSHWDFVDRSGVGIPGHYNEKHVERCPHNHVIERQPGHLVLKQRSTTRKRRAGGPR